jgi:cell fate regulator YaaT (PSP1 superfamily)
MNDSLNTNIERGCGGCCGGCKLNVYDWLSDVGHGENATDIVEVRFKNTRKDYFRNVSQLKLEVGDIVAVEANPGHDIGVVSLTGDLIKRQLCRHKAMLVNGECRKIYRKAKQADIDKWHEAIGLEHQTMIRARQIVADLKLDMKIGDVEYQGDRTKAIFYYIADGRVDFRELIKVLADTFHIRIEMKQIGARQEAGRIGGIGPCGRELCCASWISSFSSVATHSARCQEISLNPQKLAGQCGKLKCCLNFELDCYMDMQSDFPPTEIPLESEKGRWKYVKSDILARIMYYQNNAEEIVGIPVERVKEILKLNSRGIKPPQLTGNDVQKVAKEAVFNDILSPDTLTRFDRKNKKKRKPRKQGSNNAPKSDNNSHAETHAAPKTG